jgi:hypothetical protein
MLCNGDVEVPTNREEVRERLKRMTDEEVREFGRCCFYMCSPGVNSGKPPREPFVIRLERVRAEHQQRREVRSPKLRDGTLDGD